MKVNFTQGWPTIVASAVIFGSVLTITALLWRHGVFQGLELSLYDHFHRSGLKSEAVDSPVVVIGITEKDIRRYDYPIRDQELARLLDVIAGHGPRAIGLDLYRDLPEPRSRAELPALDRALELHTNVFVIRRLPHAQGAAIRAPPALDRWPERSGFNDFPLDDQVDGKVRRALLFANDGSTSNHVLHSFGLLLALHYLEPEGIWPQTRENDPMRIQLGAAEYRPLRQHDGGYVNLDAGGYQILLDWRGPTNFITYSLTEALTNAISAGTWRDKIVLVGAMADSIRDEHSTPVASKRYGVELHGQFIDQLIRTARHGGKQLRFPSERQEVALLIGSCLAGILVGGLVRHSILLLGFLVLGMVLFYALNQWAFAQGWWVPMIPAATAYAPSALGLMSFRLQREWRDKRILMQLFSKHVSPEIAQLIWRERATFMEGHRPRPQVLTVTVLFADLRDFTSLAEKTEPSVLIGWLNEYLGVMSNQIARHGGIVNEYVGDGLMATFGIPIPQQSEQEISRDATAAVRSALQMAQSLRQLNHHWSEQARPTAGMRVGIFTGPVVTGSLGSPERLKYAVVGDTVNAAALLQGFDKAYNSARSPIPECRILIGEQTWLRVGTLFESELVGSFLLKGRQEKLIIRQVLGETSLQGDP